MLKHSRDGLSKNWSVERSLKPFYRGGKVALMGVSGEIAESSESPDGPVRRLACMNSGNLSILPASYEPPFDELLEEPDEGDDEILSFTPNPVKENEVVVAMKSNLLIHWDYVAKKKLRSIRGHVMPVLALDYDGTGTLVSSGSADRSVRVWDIPRGHCTHVFREHTDIVTLVRFHPDPKKLWLVSAADDCTVCIFDLYSKQVKHRFTEHVGPVTAVSFMHDATFLVSAGRDKVLNFYSLASGQHVKTVAVMDELSSVEVLNSEHSRSVLGGEAGSKKGSKGGEDVALVTAGRKGVLHVYRVSVDKKGKFQGCASYRTVEPSPVANSEGAGKDQDIGLQSVSSLVYSERDCRLFVVTVDSNFLVYTLGAEAPADPLQMPVVQLMGCNEEILALSMFPVSAVQSAVPEPKTENDEGLSGASRPEMRVAVAVNSPQVRLVSTADGFSFKPLNGHVDIVMSLAVSPDGRWVATVSKDKTCRIWCAETQTCVGIGGEHTDAIGAVMVSQKPAGYASKQAFVVTGATDKVLKKWSMPVHAFPGVVAAASSGKKGPVPLKSSHSVRAHEKDINCIAVPPNDSIIASASHDKTIRIWRASDLFALATLRGHKRGVWCIRFSPVDRELLSCSGDRTIKTWSLVDFSCTRSFEGHGASVLSVGYIREGQQIISTSTDGIVKLWTIRTGECEATMDEHEDRIWALATGDGRGDAFFTGGSDSALQLWVDTTERVEAEQLKERERVLLMEQQMQNDIRDKKYDKALRAALDLNHSNKVLGILMSILEDGMETVARDGLVPIVNGLDVHVRTWSDLDICTVMDFLKDWNSNARFCFVAQATLNSIMRVHKRKKLESIRPVAMAFEGVMSYSTRHLERIGRLEQAANLLEYVTSSLALFPGVDALRAGGGGSTRTDTGVTRKDGVSTAEQEEDEEEEELPMAFFEGGHQPVVKEAAVPEDVVDDDTPNEITKKGAKNRVKTKTRKAETKESGGGIEGSPPRKRVARAAPKRSSARNRG